ncbi:hypothetical protein AB4K20DRAFT_1881872 [Rhizopus microsporus]
MVHLNFIITRVQYIIIYKRKRNCYLFHGIRFTVLGSLFAILTMTMISMKCFFYIFFNVMKCIFDILHHMISTGSVSRRRRLSTFTMFSSSNRINICGCI